MKYAAVFADHPDVDLGVGVTYLMIWTFLLTYFRELGKNMDDIVVFLFCLCDCVNFVFENVRHFR